MSDINIFKDFCHQTGEQQFRNKFREGYNEISPLNFNDVKICENVSKEGFVKLSWAPLVPNSFKAHDGKSYDCILLNKKGHSYYLKATNDRVLAPCPGKLTYYYHDAYNEWIRSEYALKGAFEDCKQENKKLQQELLLMKEMYCRRHIASMNNFIDIFEKYKTYSEFIAAYAQDVDKIEDTNLHDFKIRLEFFDQEYLLNYIKKTYEEINSGLSKEQDNSCFKEEKIEE